MERYYGLVIGKAVNLKHLDKTSAKFYTHFERATTEEKQNAVEIWLELHDLSPRTRDFYNVVNVQKEYLSRYIQIMSNMQFDFKLCHFQHKHVDACVEKITYSSTAYRSLNGSTYFFYETEEDEDEPLRKHLQILPLQQQYHTVPRYLKNDEYEAEFTRWIQSVRTRK